MMLSCLAAGVGYLLLMLQFKLQELYAQGELSHYVDIVTGTTMSVNVVCGLP
jgi:hypothetical protein